MLFCWTLLACCICWQAGKCLFSYCSCVCLVGPHPAVLPQQGAVLSCRCGSNDLPGKPPSLVGLQLYQALPMMWSAWSLF